MVADDLANYLAARQQDRADDVARTLAAMTERERRLVREAAVMGYVLGLRAGGVGRTKVPEDSKVLAMVIEACRSMPDVWPVMTVITQSIEEESNG